MFFNGKVCSAYLICLFLGVTLGGFSCVEELPHTAQPHQKFRKARIQLPSLKRQARKRVPRKRRNTRPSPSKVRIRYRVHVVKGKRVHAGVEALIRPYRRRLHERMSMVLATSPVALVRQRPESRLGSLVAEACLGRMRALGWKVDLFVTNLRGIRKDLAAGGIRIRDVYEILPFDNILVRLSVRGDVLRRVLEAMVRKGGEPVAGVRVVATPSGRLRGAWIQGEPLDEKKTYILGTSDYLSKTGWMAKAVQGIRLDSTDLTLRDAMIWALAERGMRWSYQLDGRVKIETAATKATSRP